MAKVKYQEGDTGIEIDASTQEMGEVANAMGIELQAPSPEEQATAEAMVAETGTELIGEPGARTAGLSSMLVRKFMKQAGRHTVEPVIGGRVDPTVKLQYDPQLKQAKEAIPEAPTFDIHNDETFATQLKEAELGDFSTNDSYQLNFDTLQDDDVATTMALFAEKNKGIIEKQRRGVQTDDILYGLAEDLRSDPALLKELVEMEAGTALPPEKIMAAKQMMTLLASDIHKLSKSYNTLDDAGKAQLRKHRAIFEKIYAPFMGARAEAGRSVRVHGLDTKVGAVQDVDQMAALLQQQSHGLNEEMIARQIALAENPKEVGAAIDATRPTLFERSFDTAYEVFINGILSGVTTHIINFTGSAIRIGVNTVDTAVAGFIGRGASNASDAVARGEWKAQMFGLTTGWNEAFAVSSKVMKTAEKYGDVDKLDTAMYDGFIKAESYALDPEGKAGKAVDWIGEIIRAPTERLMGGTDAFNKYMAERMSLSGQAYSKAVGLQEELGLTEKETIDLLQDLVANPTEEMKFTAKQDGKVMTFQESLGKSGKELQEAIQGNRFSKTIIPFFKTPMNLMKQGYLERTPFGMLTKQYKDDILAGGRRKQMAQAKMTTGTMMSLSFVALAMNGKITGHYSKDRDIRQAQMSAGWQPMSFVSTNADGTTTYTSFERIEPFSYLFGMVADVSTLMKESELRDLEESEDDMFNKMVSGLIVSIGENTLNKSFMTGARSAMEAMTEGGYKAEMWARNQINAFTPYSGLRRNIANTVDPTRRRTDGITEYWTEQMTLWNKTAAPIVDVQGREISKKHLYIPWNPADLTTNKLDLELLRIAKDTRRSAVMSVSRKMDGVKLSPTQQAAWGKYSRAELELNGQTFSQAATELINDPMYQDAYVDTQIDMLRAITKAYDNAGKEYIKANDSRLMRKILTHKLAPAAQEIANVEGGTPKDVLNRLLEEAQ